MGTTAPWSRNEHQRWSGARAARCAVGLDLGKPRLSVGRRRAPLHVCLAAAPRGWAASGALAQGHCLDCSPHGLRRQLRHDDTADDGAAHLPNKRLQLSGAEVATCRVPQHSAALLRNKRLSMFTTAPAAEAQVR